MLAKTMFLFWATFSPLRRLTPGPGLRCPFFLAIYHVKVSDPRGGVDDGTSRVDALRLLFLVLWMVLLLLRYLSSFLLVLTLRVLDHFCAEPPQVFCFGICVDAGVSANFAVPGSFAQASALPPLLMIYSQQGCSALLLGQGIVVDIFARVSYGVSAGTCVGAGAHVHVPARPHSPPLGVAPACASASIGCCC
jgi:hypothetical protein